MSNRYDGGVEGEDSLVTWQILDSGRLELVDVAGAGGVGPRGFGWGGKRGEWVVVALQGSERVVVKKRDVETGKIGGVVAGVEVKGAPAAVLWEE